MSNKEDIKQFGFLLETLLEEKGLSLLIHNPEVDVINNKYFNLIKQIVKILDNEKLDDFERVDRIVTLLHKNSLDTSCHDF